MLKRETQKISMIRLTQLAILLLAITLTISACSPAQQSVRSPPPRLSPISQQKFVTDLEKALPQLDGNDQRRAAEAQLVALELGRPGQPTPWRNPDSGTYGEVIPAPSVSNETNTCRAFKHTIYIKGTVWSLSETACRDRAGNWMISR